MSKCRHDWLEAGSFLHLAFVIDSWQGPTDAIAQCRACEAFSLVRLLHWSGRNLSTRIFALADLPPAAVEVFLRNMKSAYCDLSRHGAEVDALVATAAPVSGGIVARVPEMTVLATLARDELGKLSITSWRKRAPSEQEPFYKTLLARHDVSP